VRRTAAPLFLLLPILLALAACGAGGGDGLPEVTGKLGDKPKVTATGEPQRTLQVKVLSDGTGPEVRKGEFLVADYLGQLWRENKVFDSSYDRGPVGVRIGAGQLIPGWDEGLVGKKIGSRVLLVIPPDKGYGSSGQPQADIRGDDTLVFVVDVLGTHDPKATASGASVSSPASLPGVSGTTAPKIAIPAGKQPPESLVSQLLVRGTGPAVKKGQLLVTQYTGVLWRDGKTFDSSWQRGQPASFGIGIGQVIKGWDEGLVGKPVGSRVLLVIPPDKAYGKNGAPQAGIRADDTLVFAVDIIGAY
jgi:FKBP-type peptidyl-prolyl cis-trans isomerase